MGKIKIDGGMAARSPVVWRISTLVSVVMLHAVNESITPRSEVEPGGLPAD
ncbi:MAG: hypothetical protein H6822_19645 [Planctomycetaceae bacterium]|nr:hypothetical protein [Planctomycetales bacterium]MCB9924402.1 hypothetical protein [Planctomycetaceae bacterium]